MTLRSVICSKTVFLLLTLATAQAFGGRVSGRVSLVDLQHPNGKKSNFAGVVVWLKPLDVTSLPVPRQRAEMIQKDKRFSPHILVVSAGTTVDFPNLDPIFHNAFSNFEGQIFDIGLYQPGSSRSMRFDRSGIVRVFCNIHPSMSAVIVVVDSPYFTISREDGTYSLSNVTPGSYQIHFFHERATPETLHNLTQAIPVDSTPLQLSTRVIQEAGYLPVQHKNKFGRDYPPNADEPATYSNLSR